MNKSCVIIGLGKIGMDYDLNVIGESPIYTHARAIVAHPKLRLLGAVDVSPEQRARFERRYRAPAFDQVELAMRELQPDIVTIATPSESHAHILSKVLDVCQPGVILCEKPLAYTLNEARQIVETCEKVGIDLFVNYMRRTDPGVNEVKRRLDTGEISSPVKISAWYSKGIINNGSHLINLMEFWLGDATDATVIDSGRFWDSRDPEPDVEIKFDSHRVVLRSAWEEAFSFFSIELLSRSGRLRYDAGGEFIHWQGVRADPRFEGYRVLASKNEKITNRMDIYQWTVYDQISKYLEGSATTLCTGPQALKTLRTIDLIINKR